MTIADGLMIFAVLLGPIVAVRLTRYLDEQKEVRERKLGIFKTLMATRAYTLSPGHVEALNRIDLEFSANRRGEKKVIENWRAYLDLLGDRGIPQEQWGTRRVDLLVELLYHMGQSLGYDFDKTQIKNGTYAPVGHGRVEEEQAAIRTSLLEVLSGDRAVPMHVTNASNDNAQKMYNETGGLVNATVRE